MSRWLPAVVIAVVMALAVGCGPRHNKEKKRGIYAAPKNAQAAAWRWPGEKIEARDAGGVVAMRLRVRGSRIRAFGHKMVSLGDVRRAGDDYLLSDADGNRAFRVSRDGGDEAAADTWNVCTIARQAPAGEPSPPCEPTPSRLVGGDTVQILHAGEVVAQARSEGNGAMVERKDDSFRLERRAADRFDVTDAGGGAGTIAGAQSAFVAAAIMADEVPPLVRAGFVVIVEDHHGKWSLSP